MKEPSVSEDCGRKHAASALRDVKQKIIETWMSRCKSELSAARSVDRLSLRDSLPDFLDQLFLTLEHPDRPGEYEKNARVAREHGEERANLPQYSLSQVIREYGILRETLTEILNDAVSLSQLARKLLHRFIDSGIEKAASQFVETSESKIFDAGAQLRIVQEKLEKAISVSRLGFYDWNIERDVVEFSDRMRSDWGIRDSGSFGEAIGRIHPDDQERVRLHIESAMTERKPYLVEYRVVQSEGGTVWIEAQGDVTFDAKGVPIRFFGTSLDITSRKQIEIDLAKERHKLEAIFHESPAAMVLWRGHDYVFEKINPVYQQIFGDRDVEGRPLLEALPEIKRQVIPELLDNVVRTGQKYVGHEMLVQLRRSEKGPLEDRYYDFTYARVDTPDAEFYGVYNHAVDVTDRVLARRALEANGQRLKSLVADLEKERALRERFVAMLSHDLRSPMSAAKMAIQMLTRKQAVTPLVKKHTESAILNIDRAESMIQKLLDVSRIEAGEAFSLHLGKCSLDKVVGEVVGDLRPLYGDRFVVQPASSPAEGIWDYDGIKRIVENLVFNALKYGAEGRPITVAVTNSSENRCGFSVHNEGNPLSAEECTEIFDAYHRASRAESGLHEGWGLGLALVRGMAEAHGGSVKVESSNAGGTTFFIDLPSDSRCPR